MEQGKTLHEVPLEHVRMFFCINCVQGTRVSYELISQSSLLFLVIIHYPLFASPAALLLVVKTIVKKPFIYVFILPSQQLMNNAIMHLVFILNCRMWRHNVTQQHTAFMHTRFVCGKY